MTRSMKKQPVDDLLIEQYKLLITLQTGESDRFWERYNVFLALNAAIIVGLGFLSSKDVMPTLTSVAPVISTFGLISCIVWFFQTASGSHWQGYWIAKARHIEEQHKLFDIYRDIRNYRDKAALYQKMSTTKGALVAPLLLAIFWSSSIMIQVYGSPTLNDIGWLAYITGAIVMPLFTLIYLLRTKREEMEVSCIFCEKLRSAGGDGK